jgi:hypothetical protein
MKLLRGLAGCWRENAEPSSRGTLLFQQIRTWLCTVQYSTQTVVNSYVFILDLDVFSADAEARRPFEFTYNANCTLVITNDMERNDT